MEFLAVNMITAPIGPATAAIYALLVNFRHVFYALNYPVHALKNPVTTFYGVYSLTDEVYAILSSRPDTAWNQGKMMGAQFTLQFGWVSGGLVGALCGNVIPDSIQGSEFALVALFLVLLIEAYDARREPLMILAALAAGGLGLALSPDNTLLIGMLLYTGVLMLRYARGERA